MKMGNGLRLVKLTVLAVLMGLLLAVFPVPMKALAQTEPTKEKPKTTKSTVHKKKWPKLSKFHKKHKITAHKVNKIHKKKPSK